MQDQVRDWLIAQGYPAALELEEMRRGLGSAELWSFKAGPEHQRMVVRLFPAVSTKSAEWEALVMETAAREGLPVPPPVARGVVDGKASAGHPVRDG